MIHRIGGEDRARLPVDTFYDLIETLPQGGAILDKHLRGHGMSHVRSAQFEFLCGFLGGRRHYAERHGHMNLRDIHAHVGIRPQDARDWLAVMGRALAETGVGVGDSARIMQTLRRAALSLVNA